MEYELSPTLAAQEGDTRLLCERLRNSAVAITMAERRCAADLIEGKLERPRNRPPSVKTRLRAIDIARYIKEQYEARGDWEAAVRGAMEEFKCGRTTVVNAFKDHRNK